MKFIYRYFVFMALLVSYQGRAQIGLKLGTSPGTLNSGAIMDLSGASNRGFLLPRVSLPASLTTFGLNGQPDVGSNGMMVYNTNTNTPGGVGYYVWSGTTALNTGGAWSRILTGSTILAPNVSLTGTSAPAGSSTGQLIYNTATGISGVPVGLAVWNGSSWVSLAPDNLGNHTATQNLNMGAFAVTGMAASNDPWRIYGAGATTDAGELRIQSGDNGNEPIIFEQFTTPATTNERMRIHSNGNVGIGTSAPFAPLTVQTPSSLGTGGIVSSLASHRGESAFTLNTFAGVGSNNTGDLLFSLGQAYSGSVMRVGLNFHRGVGDTDGSLAILTNTAERLRVLSDGTVRVNNLAGAVGSGNRMVIASETGVLGVQPIPTAASSATTSAQGIIQLAGDLTGTATAPTIANSAVTSAKLANNLTFPGTANVTIPSGTTAQRPTTPSNGMMRYNTSTNAFELYQNGAWVNSTDNIYTASGTLTSDRQILLDAKTLDIRGGSADRGNVTNQSILRLSRTGISNRRFNPMAEFAVGGYDAGASSTVAGTRLGIRLSNGNVTAPDSVVMTLLSNGRVGIGTAAPDRVLHTVGDAVRFDRNGGAPGATTAFMPQALFVNTNGTQIYKTWVSGMANSTMDYVISDYGTSVGGTLGTQRLVISGETGNVGIGTSLPTAKLHVTEGNILFDVNNASQNVHIVGQGTPANYTTAPSAALDVSSLNKGFLPPRMTYTQILAISNPADGLIVYCIDCNPKSPLFFNGTEWSSYDGKTAPKKTGDPFIELSTPNPLNNINLVFDVTGFGSWTGLNTDGEPITEDDFNYEWFRRRGTVTTPVGGNASSLTAAGATGNLHQTGDTYFCFLTTKTLFPVRVKSNEISLDFSGFVISLIPNTPPLTIQGAGNFFEVIRDYNASDYNLGSNPTLTKSWEYQNTSGVWVTINTTSVPGFTTSSTNGNINVNIPLIPAIIDRPIRRKVVASNTYGPSVTSVSNEVLYSYLLNSQLLSTERLPSTTTVAQNVYAAYSVRRLNSSYTGSAMRIFASTGTQFADIGFTESGDLDVSAITTFMDANNSSAFVGTWYDQSGNNRHASIATASARPLIATRSGTTNTLVTFGTRSRPALSFDGSNDILYIGGNSRATAANFTSIVPPNTNTSPFPGLQLLFAVRQNGNASGSSRNGGLVSTSEAGNSSADHFGGINTSNQWFDRFFVNSRKQLPNITANTNYVGSLTVTSQDGSPSNFTARLGGALHGQGTGGGNYSPNQFVRIGSESGGNSGSNVFARNLYSEVIIRSLPNGTNWSSTSNNLTNTIEMSMGLYFGVTVSNQ